MEKDTNQDTFQSAAFGTLHFFPAKNGIACPRCILNRYPEECHRAPCSPGLRKDGRDGYFSIHTTPKND